MLTKQFWFSDTGVLVRAIRTFAQTATAMAGVGTTNLFTADLKNVVAVSASAAILSILMSLDRSADKSTQSTEQQLQSSYQSGCGEDLR